MVLATAVVALRRPTAATSLRPLSAAPAPAGAATMITTRTMSRRRCCRCRQGTTPSTGSRTGRATARSTTVTLRRWPRRGDAVCRTSKPSRPVPFATRVLFLRRRWLVQRGSVALSSDGGGPVGGMVPSTCLAWRVVALISGGTECARFGDSVSAEREASPRRVVAALREYCRLQDGLANVRQRGRKEALNFHVNGGACVLSATRCPKHNSLKG